VPIMRQIYNGTNKSSAQVLQFGTNQLGSTKAGFSFYNGGQYGVWHYVSPAGSWWQARYGGQGDTDFRFNVRSDGSVWFGNGTSTDAMWARFRWGADNTMQVETNFIVLGTLTAANYAGNGYGLTNLNMPSGILTNLGAANISDLVVSNGTLNLTNCTGLGIVSGSDVATQVANAVGSALTNVAGVLSVGALSTTGSFYCAGRTLTATNLSFLNLGFQKNTFSGAKGITIGELNTVGKGGYAVGYGNSVDIDSYAFGSGNSISASRSTVYGASCTVGEGNDWAQYGSAYGNSAVSTNWWAVVINAGGTSVGSHGSNTTTIGGQKGIFLDGIATMSSNLTVKGTSYFGSTNAAAPSIVVSNGADIRGTLTAENYAGNGYGLTNLNLPSVTWASNAVAAASNDVVDAKAQIGAVSALVVAVTALVADLTNKVVNGFPSLTISQLTVPVRITLSNDLRVAGGQINGTNSFWMIQGATNYFIRLSASE